MDGNTPIPENVNPTDWVSVFLCIPNDTDWIAAFRGLVSSFTRGRYWRRDDRQTSIIDAQAVGLLIEDSIMICDITTQLAEIAEAIRSQSFQVSCCDPLTPPTPPTTTYDDLPPASDPIEPAPPWADPLDTYADTLCMLYNGIYAELLAFAEWLDKMDTWLLGVTGIVALLAVVFPDPITTAIGTATLLQIAAKLLSVSTVLDEVNDLSDNTVSYIQVHEQELACIVAGAQSAFDAAVAFADYVSGAMSEYLVLRGVPLGIAEYIVSWAVIPEYIQAKVALWYETGEVTALPAGVSPLSCDCAPSYDWDTGIETFEGSVVSFTLSGDGIQTYAAQGAPSPDGSARGAFYNPRSNTQTSAVTLSRGAVDTLGVPNTQAIRATQIDFDLYVGSSYAPKLLWLSVYDDIDGEVQTDLLQYASPGNWVNISLPINVDRAGSQGNVAILSVRGNWNSNNDVSPPPINQAFIDNLRVRGVVL